MASFTIFGNGNMGAAIGDVLTTGGNEVSYITSTTAGSAEVVGEIAIIATPYAAIADIVANYAEQLVGKTVVDISNPLNFETFDSLVVSEGSSAAAELQKALPNSRVLKAFNTNFAATLVSKQIGDAATTVLIAGDDADAKQALAAAVTAGGLQAIDAGSLKRAHELEAIGFLQLTLAASEKIAWTAGFAVVR